MRFFLRPILSGIISRVKRIHSFEKLRRNTKKFIHKDEFFIDENTIFLVFIPATDYYYLPYFQLYRYKNVFVDFSYINSNEFILKTLRKIPTRIFYRKFVSKKYDPSKRYVIFFDGQYSLCSQRLKCFLRNRYPDCMIIFHLGDLLSTHKNINISEIKDFSDLVVTYDHNDAENNIITYHSHPYSSLPSEMLACSEGNSQLLFYGYAKNRSKLILQVYDKMKASGVKCDFSIPGLTSEDCSNRPELANAKFTPYLDYLKKLQCTDCILEIIQSGSQGCTFRTWEAIVYNKKLITNNKSIKDEPFYNQEYIQVIDSVESINVEWIKKDIKVNYGYADQISPKACFEFYIKCINNS